MIDIVMNMCPQQENKILMVTPINDSFIWAYIAGMFDFDGYMGIVHHKNLDRYVLRITLSSHSIEIMDFIVHHLGGHYSRLKDRSLRSNKPIYYRWVCGAKRAIPLLKNIYPMMIRKKRQAAILMSFAETVDSSVKELTSTLNDYRRSLYEELNKVNRENNVTLRGRKYDKEGPH